MSPYLNEKEFYKAIDSDTIEVASNLNTISLTNTIDITSKNADKINSLPSKLVPTKKKATPRLFQLEPVIFFISLATSFTEGIFNNQVLYQACTADFSYDEASCKPLKDDVQETDQAQQIQSLVQPYASNIILTRSLIEVLITAFITLLIGAWSDKFGRKPVLLASLIGTTVGMFVLCIIAFISTTSRVTPWLYLLASVPTVMGGSVCAFMALVYCYISDASTGTGKAFRMLYTRVSHSVGNLTGGIVSGYLYTATNAGVVFLLAAIFMFLGLAYCIFFVPESLRPEQMQTGGHKIREFLRIDLVKDIVNTCINRRKNYDRLVICFAILIIFFNTFATEGDLSVIYLFLRLKFQWTLDTYTNYKAIRIMAHVIFGTAGLYALRRYVNACLVAIVMTSLACCLLESTARAAAIVAWVMYLGIALGLVCGIVIPMSLTIISNVVAVTEVGKIFAITTALVTIAPVMASPLYTAVYNASQLTYPGSFNCISVGLYLLAFSMISIMFDVLNRHENLAIYHAIIT